MYLIFRKRKGEKGNTQKGGNNVVRDSWLNFFNPKWTVMGNRQKAWGHGVS